ncbi:hypothetical protein [Streptomyces sp. NBC_00358]|uniref:hypothetical protein n=1 Tax=Streptomyces sp. NBC_00358 TaxID=2975725 RepID=UPI002E26230D
MTKDNVASPAGRQPAGRTSPARPDSPELGLARSLLATEYALSARRPGTDARSGGTDDAWDQLARELRRFIDTLRGRSPSRGGASAAGGGSQADGSSGRAEPESAQAMRGGPPGQALSTQPTPSSREAFEGTISRLPLPARQAFEDAVLALVRTEEKWRTAYDSSPESMPSVAMYANNAYLRELRRNAPPSADPPQRTRNLSQGAVPRTATAAEAVTTDRTPTMAQDRERSERGRAVWERRAPGRRGPVASSATSGFDRPVEDGMSDGHAFQAAQRARYAQSTDDSRNPGRHQLSDAIGLQAAQEARLERVTALPVSPTPTPVQQAGRAVRAWNDTGFSDPDREPSILGHDFPMAETTPLFGSHDPVPLALLSPMTPMSAPSSPALTATNAPRPLLSDAGRRAALDSITSTHSGSTSRSSASRSGSTPVPTSMRTGQNTNTTTPKARRL